MPRRILPLIILVTAVVSCGSDPGTTINDSPATQPTSGGVDLSGATFEDLTGEASPKVDAVDNVFKAQYIEVKAGAAVTFRNDGRNSHNVIPVDETQFGAIPTDEFEPGAEDTITFAKPGDYAYYCSLHGTTTRGMTGAVRVVK